MGGVRTGGGGGPPRVVILGGGFGGLYAARALAARARARDIALAITLVDRAERFTFKPLLYELLTDEVDEDDIAPPLERVLDGTGVRFVRGEVRAIDLDARRVALVGTAGPAFLEYDALAIALGAEPDFRGLPGLAERALPAATLDDFRRIEAHLAEVRSRPASREADGERPRRVAICGAGPSGVEIACKLADMGDLAVALVEASGGILPGFSEELKAVARATIAEKKIDLRLSAPVVGADERGLILAAGPLEAATIVWTAGMRPVAAIRELPVERDAAGRIKVGATLEVPGRQGVFAIGDGAKCVVEGVEAPPATAQVAVQQAGIAARNILARLEGKTMSSYRYLPLAETLSLGRGRDAFHLLGVKLSGRTGNIARRLVYLARLPTWQEKAIVGARWGVRWVAEAIGAGAAYVLGDKRR